jgi:hypothetical protein
MRVDAPKALYADHDDIRLTDDGRFLVIAGGVVAHRWEVPATRNDSPRKTDSWNLHPAFSNRLAIAADGTILLCRNETRSGADYPVSRTHPAADPRCVRIYELQPGGMKRQIAQHDDHAWHVFSILAIPDGSGFIADGIKTRDKKSNSIVAYAARAKEVLWSIPIPESPQEGSSVIDSTGTLLHYKTGVQTHLQRAIPYRGQPDMPASYTEYPALGRQIVFKQIQGVPTGLHLAAPGAARPFLTLSPDEQLPLGNWHFTPDGRSLIWGSEDGTVMVCDMDRVRESLASVGMGWEKTR